jgi:hypothetical protein
LMNCFFFKHTLDITQYQFTDIILLVFFNSDMIFYCGDMPKFISFFPYTHVVLIFSVINFMYIVIYSRIISIFISVLSIYLSIYIFIYLCNSR